MLLFSSLASHIFFTNVIRKFKTPIFLFDVWTPQSQQGIQLDIEVIVT